MQLSRGENLILKAEKHWMYFFWPLVGTLLTVVLGVWLIYRIARYFIDEIIITNQRFSIEVGVISKNIISTPLDKINNVHYSQGALGRMFGYGTIVVQSAATMGASGYSYIKNPSHVKAILEDTIEKYELEKAKKIKQHLEK